MATVVIVDETVVLAAPGAVAAAVGDRARWVAWWPGLEATVVADRGVEGMTWSIAGDLVGTTQVALTVQETGVLVRYVLDADPSAPGSRTVPRRLPDSPHGRRELESLRRRHLMAWQSAVWVLRRELEA